MMALRCTAKLLKAMKLAPWPDPAPPKNRLGDWTANLIRVGRIQLVIAVSEPTRLGVVVDAAPYATIPERFAFSVMRSLVNLLEVPHELAAAEIDAMQPLEITSSNSKSVLSTVNRYALDLEATLYHGQAGNADDLNAHLVEQVVCAPSHIGHPADRAREAFGLAPWDWRARFERRRQRRAGLLAAANAADGSPN